MSLQKKEGTYSATGLKIAIVAARFNDFFVSHLVDGAIDSFLRHGGLESDLSVSWVPGAMEIPLASKALAKSKKYDAVVCLGAVIRGATSHYEIVTAEVSKGVAQVGLETELPILFGVLTTDTMDQAMERAGSKAGNKGAESMLGAIEMVNLLKEIRR